MAARMAVRSLSLLVLVAVALRESSFGASSHSLMYFYSSISDPDQGLPHFVSVGYLDGQVFVHYDSYSRRMKPRVSWMEKVGKEEPQYWDRNTQRERGNEETFRENLEIARKRYNQSEGLHTWQLMYGCELQRDGSKAGFIQYGYEGRTFIVFDKETLTWVAPDPLAQITQRKWDAFPGYNQRNKVYLEEICIEWLEKYLSYGNETLLRTDPPVVTLSNRTEAEDGMETHVCQVHGFYPREIDASWTRDGEVWLQDTLHASVAPNADGTYHYWLSVRIDPKERGRYRCHVDHDGLQDPLDVALNGPPVVTMSRTETEDGMETHVCHMGGFYPREIDASWRKDGEIWLLDTSHGSVTPNADGTYHYWLSIQIDPKERSRYRCHVEHVGLQEPLDVALKGPPVVTMSRTKMKDGMETHICHMDGFYPREIDASWRKDGEIRLDTSHGSVTPNADGTYRYWLSIQIDPKERDRYRCHVEHDSLQEPLDVAPKGPPVVTMSRTETEDGMETHVCHMGGFYPREIDASWRKDGEIWLLDTSHGSVTPNADGTYHYWLSIQIDPKERSRYRCHVEHVGLQEPLDVALKGPPVVTMSRTEMKDGMETHICHMDGFYPREIDASWRKDGEIRLLDTSHGSVTPNADGTYRYWLSIQIDPKERDRYRCHVEHDSLREPLDVALKAERPQVPESNQGVIIGCVVAVVFLVIVGSLIFYKKRRDGYNAVSRSNQVT